MWVRAWEIVVSTKNQIYYSLKDKKKHQKNLRTFIKINLNFIGTKNNNFFKTRNRKFVDIFLEFNSCANERMATTTAGFLDANYWNHLQICDCAVIESSLCFDWLCESCCVTEGKEKRSFKLTLETTELTLTEMLLCCFARSKANANEMK